jgi:hypothetical protein
MNASDRTAGDGNTLLGTFAAELTTAAYAVALRHGKGHSWLDLQLDLWKTLQETVRRWGDLPASQAGGGDRLTNPGPAVG